MTPTNPGAPLPRTRNYTGWLIERWGSPARWLKSVLVNGYEDEHWTTDANEAALLETAQDGHNEIMRLGIARLARPTEHAFITTRGEIEYLNAAPLPPAPTPVWPQLTDSERVAHNDALWLRLFTRPHDMDCLEEYRKYLLPGDVQRIREIADRILQAAAPPAGEAPTTPLGEWDKQVAGAVFNRVIAIADAARASTGEGETPNVTTAWPQYWLCTVCMRSRRGDEDCPYCRIAALEADAATHARALAEAQQDAKRLDWLETEEWNHRAEQFLRFTPKVKGRLRAAIDAARSVSPREGANAKA